MVSIKLGMKAGILLRYSQEMIDSNSDFANIMKRDFEREKRKLLLKESIRVLNWDMKHGHDGNDFVYNMYSFVFSGRSYKVPRIVKKMLLK